MRINGSVGLAGALRAEVSEIAADAVDVATSGLLAAVVVRSSGPYSLAELRRKDHPYAKRHGSPLLDPGRVNAQTGKFRASWGSRSLGALHKQVVNTDPVSEYLVTKDGRGTKYMFHRGVDAAAQEDLVKQMPALTYVKALPGV